MLETSRVVQVEAQLTAFIHLTVPRAEIRDVMGPGLEEVLAALAAQGIVPTGPWFTHHRRIVPDVFDFEICLPVDRAITPGGRVRPGRWPAGPLARTVYQGPYEGLAAAWGEFDSWITAQALTPAGDLWERYLVGPESSPDASGWRTELSRPLRA